MQSPQAFVKELSKVAVAPMVPGCHCRCEERSHVAISWRWANSHSSINQTVDVIRNQHLLYVVVGFFVGNFLDKFVPISVGTRF